MKDHLNKVTIAARRHGGTHLINPLCKRLAGRKCFSADKARSLFVPTGPLVVFTRDPRNTLISRLRWDLKNKGLPANPPPDFGYDEKLARRLGMTTMPNDRDPPEFWYLTGMKYQLAYWGYWLALGYPKIVSRFETLANEDTGVAETARIGEYLQTKEDPEAIFRGLFRVSPTYNGSFSDWREWFGPLSMEAFKRNGGPAVLAVMGYKE